VTADAKQGEGNLDRPGHARGENRHPTEHRVHGRHDQLEIALNQDVCSGRMTLGDAQQCIRIDWVACERRVGMPTP
jgi:hypothetical protein